MTGRGNHDPLDEPCRACGQPSVRMLGIHVYCHECAEALLDPIRRRILWDESGIGIGFQHGRTRPDWGPGFAELECSVCSATWVGPVGEECGYCLRTHEALLDAHRAALLRPDPEMLATAQKQADWVRRLAWAVDAGLLHEHEARAVIRRQEAQRAS